MEELEQSKAEIPIVDRNSIARKPSGEVVLCPSRIDGGAFLKKYNAWGFVNIGKAHSPEYFTMYVGAPESAVLYFGEIDSITRPIEAKEEIRRISEEDMKTFEPGKRVIHLKPGTLVKFRDSIPSKNKKMAPRGLRYTSLDKLTKASHVEEL